MPRCHVTSIKGRNIHVQRLHKGRKLFTWAASSTTATSKRRSRRSRISTPVSVVHTTAARCISRQASLSVL